MSRFLTFLASFTATLSISLIPHSAMAATTGNCGALPGGSGAAEVTCSDPTYNKTDGPPIRYNLAAPGRSVTLTVRPSGAGTVTITSSGITSGARDARPGIVLSGPGALKKVVLNGRVHIENGATRRLVTGLPTTVTRTGKAIDSRDRGAGLNHGIYVGHLGSDIDAQKDHAEVMVGAQARIGTEGKPMGGFGVLAYFQHDTDVSVTNAGEIYGTYAGILAHRSGGGDTVIKTAKGSVTSQGIWASAGDLSGEVSNTRFVLINQGPSPGGGDITIVHEGKIVVQSHPLRYLTTTTPTMSEHVESRSSYARAGLDVFHQDKSAPAADGQASSEISITSSGDIEIVTDPGIRPLRSHGVRVITKGDDDSVVPVTVGVTGGTIMGVGEEGHAIRIHHEHSGGLIKVDLAGGTITADGHGVYVETATTYEDATKAGKIEVTVGEMATIRAKKDGVHVKGMRTFASDHARKGQYDQTVTINGKVMGGGGDHAGVRMVMGGTLVIGPKAKVEAASGTAMRADGELTITMSKDAVGRVGYVKGKMLNSGTTTFDGVKVGGEYTLSPGVEERGAYDISKVTLKTIEGGHQFMDSGRAYHDRARVYEALPSVLLEMSAPGGRQARLSATRDGGGVWARVMASDGEREAETSTTSMDAARHDLSWDFERWGVATGIAVPTDLPGVTLGVSAHYRDGEADVKRGGKIEASGVGIGASATWRGEDGWYADGELSYTRFEDVDLSSETRGMVASGLDGEGHAISVEVGRRLEMDGFALVPRGGLTWTWVDVDGFADVSGVTGSGRVSFRSEDSVRARVGALLENGQTYASLDVEHEFSESREAMASGARLRSEVESTWARVGVGGVMTLDARGESTLSADAHYAASGGDNHDYGVSVLLKVRF